MQWPRNSVRRRWLTWIPFLVLLAGLVVGSGVYSRNASSKEALRALAEKAASAEDPAQPSGTAKAATASKPPEKAQTPGTNRTDDLAKQAVIASAMPPSMGRDSFLDDLRRDRKKAARDEEDREKILEEVKQESPQESVKALTERQISPAFCRFTEPSRFHDSGLGVAFLANDLIKDPRTEKLLGIIKNGYPEDVEAVHEALLKAVSAYLNVLPDNYDPRGVSVTTVMLPGGNLSIPILLAAFPPSPGNLGQIADMSDRLQAACQHEIENSWPSDKTPPDYMHCSMSSMLAYGANQVLSGLGDAPNSAQTLSEEQKSALSEYVRFRDNYRDLASAYAPTLVKIGFAQPSLFENLTPEMLDYIAWQYASNIGATLMTPRDPLADYTRERQILGFAHRVARP